MKYNIITYYKILLKFKIRKNENGMERSFFNKMEKMDILMGNGMVILKGTVIPKENIYTKQRNGIEIDYHFIPPFYFTVPRRV